MANSDGVGMTKRLPDTSGKDVAVYWYKTMRNYYFLKDPSVLHAYASTVGERLIRF